MVYGNQ
jgi:hypothetical protein